MSQSVAIIPKYQQLVKRKLNAFQSYDSALTKSPRFSKTAPSLTVLTNNNSKNEDFRLTRPTLLEIG